MGRFDVFRQEDGPWDPDFINSLRYGNFRSRYLNQKTDLLKGGRRVFNVTTYFHTLFLCSYNILYIEAYPKEEGIFAVLRKPRQVLWRLM